MSDLTERVARAIYEAGRESLRTRRHDTTGAWGDLSSSSRWTWMAAARAAIEVVAPEKIENQRMRRSPVFETGYRLGVKDCVEWLHGEADTMNDPHARKILNVAASGMGARFSPRGSEKQ